MQFREFIRSMTPEQRADYAQRCNTTDRYLVTHLLPARKVPRTDLLNSLVDQSHGQISKVEALEHFGLL